MASKQKNAKKISFQKVEFSQIKQIRENYLDQLYEAQELYLEMITWESDYYAIITDKTIGYFFLTKENVLCEFHLQDEQIPNAEATFKAVLEEFGIKKILCKSFDSLLLKCCLPLHKKSAFVGYSFRDYLKPAQQEKSPLSFRLATAEDFSFVSKIKDGLFDFDQEIIDTISNQNMFIYSLGDTFIGCGIFQPAVKGRKHYDIGMLVHPEFRKQGHGTMIIRQLAGYCEQNAWIPVCGCAFENVASRKTLEKAGFVE